MKRRRKRTILPTDIVDINPSVIVKLCDKIFVENFMNSLILFVMIVIFIFVSLLYIGTNNIDNNNTINENSNNHKIYSEVPTLQNGGNDDKLSMNNHGPVFSKIEEMGMYQMDNTANKFSNQGLDTFSYSFKEIINVTTDQSTYIIEHPASGELWGLSQINLVEYRICCSYFIKEDDGIEYEFIFHKRLCGNTRESKCVIRNNRIYIIVEFDKLDVYQIAGICIFNWIL